MNELNELLTILNPDTLQSKYIDILFFKIYLILFLLFSSQSIKAAAYYVLGLNSYFQARYNDAKFVILFFILN